ncbi:uncharacterized protein LOC126826787 [Patella vulgata]|uniref:uncharacterized protein LOC126826787 n=1 Tax=Patella vulgata TaxID=6465 RepID=UPI00217FEE7E|nr:uncharacterized protein LOC126826787 [Patella vulgata]
MSKKLKQKHVTIFKKNLEEKVKALKEQKDEVSKIVIDFITDVEQGCTLAEELIQSTDSHKLQKKYQKTMQLLDQHYYNCTVLAATVEEFNESTESSDTCSNQSVPPSMIDTTTCDESEYELLRGDKDHNPKFKDKKGETTLVESSLEILKTAPINSQDFSEKSKCANSGPQCRRNLSQDVNQEQLSVAENKMMLDQDFSEIRSSLTLTQSGLDNQDIKKSLLIDSQASLPESKPEVRLDIQELRHRLSQDAPLSFCCEIVASDNNALISRYVDRYSDATLSCSEDAIDFDNVPCSSPVKIISGTPHRENTALVTEAKNDSSESGCSQRKISKMSAPVIREVPLLKPIKQPKEPVNQNASKEKNSRSESVTSVIQSFENRDENTVGQDLVQNQDSTNLGIVRPKPGLNQNSSGLGIVRPGLGQNQDSTDLGIIRPELGQNQDSTDLGIIRPELGQNQDSTDLGIIRPELGQNQDSTDLGIIRPELGQNQDSTDLGMMEYDLKSSYQESMLDLSIASHVTTDCYDYPTEYMYPYYNPNFLGFQSNDFPYLPQDLKSNPPESKVQLPENSNNNTSYKPVESWDNVVSPPIQKHPMITHENSTNDINFSPSQFSDADSVESKTSKISKSNSVEKPGNKLSPPTPSPEESSSSRTSSSVKSRKLLMMQRAKLANKVKACLETSRAKFGIDVKKGLGVDSSSEQERGKISSDKHSTDEKNNSECETKGSHKVNERHVKDPVKTILEYGYGPKVDHFRPVLNQPIHVMVCELNSPWSFYVHSYSSALDELMACIQQYVSSYKDEYELPVVKDMICLAKFKLDGNFYRAKVRNIKGDKVTVQYIDYGNQEEVMTLDLRPLNSQLAQLPAQAVFCAIAGLAPAERDRSWTEDEINILTIHVKSQVLLCKAVYCSDNPSFPHLVELVLMVWPDSNRGQQWNFPCVNMNLSAIMIRQERGRFIPISEQLDCLRVMYKQVLKNAHSVISSIEKDKAKANTKNDSLDDKVSVESGFVSSKTPHQSPVLSVDSFRMQQGSNSLTSNEKRQTIPKDEEQKFENDVSKEIEKSKSEEHDRSKVGNEKSEIDNKLKVVKDKDNDNDTVTVDIKKVKVDNNNEEVKVDIEKHIDKSIDVGKISQSSETTMKSHVKDDENTHISCHQKNVSKESKRAATKTEEKSSHNTRDKNTRPNTESFKTMLASKSEETVASKHLTKEELKNTETDTKIKFNVLMAHINTPGDFYVHKVSLENGQILDKLMENINRKFFAYTKKRLEQLSRDFLPKVNDFCCAKFKDGFYYRGKVVELISKGNVKSSKKYQEVIVFYVDFGDKEKVSINQVYPLPKEFTVLPPIALWCCLSNIKPLAQNTTSWPLVSTVVFKELCSESGKDDKMLSVTVACDNLPKSGSVQLEPLPVFLVDYNQKEEVCFNLELIRLGFAQALINRPETPPQIDDELLLDWDPMQEDFNSIRNSYKIDVDDPSVATMSYDAKDDRRICRWYNTPGECWRGDRCPYLHIKKTDVITQDKEAVFVWNEDQSEILPEVDTLVVVVVSTIISPRHFYVLLPYGKVTLDYLQTQKDKGAYREAEENLEDLQKSLNSIYRRGGSQHDLLVYAAGQAVAVQGHDNKWYRGKVIDTNPEDERVKIFFVDFGNTSWINERNIRKLEAQFLHLPLQAVECFLEEVELPKRKTVWSYASREYFRSLVDGKTLVAQVTSRSWHGSLKINLFDTSGRQDINIAQALIDGGYACETPDDFPATNVLSGSSQDSIVYVPG